MCNSGKGSEDGRGSDTWCLSKTRRWIENHDLQEYISIQRLRKRWAQLYSNNVSNPKKHSLGAKTSRRRRKRRRTRREGDKGEFGASLASAGSRGGGGRMRRAPAGRQNRTTCPLQALKLAIISWFLCPPCKQRWAGYGYKANELIT